MDDNPGQLRSRRDILRQGLSTALALSTGPWVHIGQATPKRTLRILQWKHFVPDYDKWFNGQFIKDWGERNNAQVVVDNVGIPELNDYAQKDLAVKDGHDIVMFLSPPCRLEPHLVDLSDVYQDIVRLHGPSLRIGELSSFNPVTKKRYCLTDSYVPDPVNYRKDLWDDVGHAPDSWDNIRAGAKKIKNQHNVPLGIGLASDLDSNMCLRTIMTAFGAYEQTDSGHPGIKSKQTREVLKFVKALYEESMNIKVLSWNPSSNNRVMLAGRCSLTLNAPSITRTGEQYDIPIADKIHLGIAPKGPENQKATCHLMSNYAIWNFSKEQALAKQFLVDFVGQFHQAFLASRFYNLPCFTNTVKNMEGYLQHDPAATPSDKYAILSHAYDWSNGLGYPGYASAMIDDSLNNFVVPTMFASVATGKLTPDEAMNEAHKKLTAYHEYWHDRKLL